MNYTEALEYIHGISWTFCKPGLERIEELCNKLGNPERDLRFVHVAGTNGKGSFCSMLASVLTKAGYRTGLYTSPFIKEFNERMRVDGENIEDTRLADITERVRPIADSMTDKPTEFELITAIAFLYFKEMGCDVVVLEAGMGGRLDSTNVIRNPLLSVITGIALDHTAFLGDTTAKIAAEKAGIIKDGAPVLWCGSDPEAHRVISDTARERGSLLFTPDRTAEHVKQADLNGTVFDYRDRRDVKISLLGLYQPHNAANVLEAVDILKSRGLDIPESAVREGLAATKWSARFEIISHDPTVIFDGAHNPEGILAAVESISHYFGDTRIAVLTGVLRDKDYTFIAKTLSSVASRAFTITPDNPRALTAEEYADTLESFGVTATPEESIETALRRGMQYAKENNVPLVCLGSLYTYVDVITSIERRNS